MNHYLDEMAANFKISQPGTRIIYHYGFLCNNRGRGGKTEREEEISWIANKAYEAYLAGFVELFQTRIKENMYHYIAVTMDENGRLKRALSNKELYDSVRKEYWSLPRKPKDTSIRSVQLAGGLI